MGAVIVLATAAEHRDKRRTSFTTTSLIFKITSASKCGLEKLFLKVKGPGQAVIRPVRYSTAEPSCGDSKLSYQSLIFINFAG